MTKGVMKKAMTLMISAFITGGLCTDITAVAQNVNGQIIREDKIRVKEAGVTESAGDQSCGEGVTWKLESGTLTISGNGEMKDYESSDKNQNASPWYSQRELINKVVVEEGVSKIGRCAFYGSNLKSVDLPASITSIEMSAFESTKLESIVIPDGVPRIEDEVFSRCSNLKSVIIPKSVKSIQFAAFFGCSSLKNIEIPEGVTYIEMNGFSSCANLQSVKLPNSLRTIWGNAFAYCSSLQNVELPPNVTRIDENAFKECSSLRSINIPDSVTIIESGAFIGCDKLSMITVPKSVTEIVGKVYGYNAQYEKYPNVKIRCYTDSAAHKYALSNGIPYELLDSPADTSAIKATKVSISGVSKKIAAGKKVKLTAKVLPANAANKKVTWKSSNKKVATVNSSGVVTMKNGSGGKTVIITAIAKDGSGKKGIYKLTSMKGIVKSIKLSGKTSVKAGKSVKLKAKVTASKNANKNLQWSSSNTKYAKVSKSGTITTYKAGKGKKVRITAKATDGSNKKRSIAIRIK